MTILPQINARLTAIIGPGTSEDWDDDAGAGQVKWSGNVGAYESDNLRTNFSQTTGGLVRNADISIIIPELPGVEIKTGDTVTYIFKGKTKTARISDYNDPYLPGLSKYIKLHLEQQMVEAGE